MKTDVQKEKYLRLMILIEALEEKIEKLEAEKSPDAVSVEKIRLLKDELAANRNELTRISDGCGTPHAK